MLITDNEIILGAGKKRKQVLGITFVPHNLSEQDKHNKNPVKRAIQNFKARCSKIRNSCGMGVITY